MLTIGQSDGIVSFYRCQYESLVEGMKEESQPDFVVSEP
jgi:hypothetical protein